MDAFIWHHLDEEKDRYILDLFLSDGYDSFGTMYFNPTVSDALDYKFNRFYILVSMEEQIASFRSLSEFYFLTDYSKEYNASSPQLSPDQSFIVFDLFNKSEDKHYLAKIDTSGTNKRLIGEYTFSDKTTNAENFRISHDSKKVFFIRENKIWKTKITSESSEEIATLPFSPKYLALSPDGLKIAFITDDQDYSGVYYFDMHNSELVAVTRQTKDVGAVGFRNNHQLIFSQPGEQGGLHSFDLKTNKLTKLIGGDIYNKGRSVFNNGQSRTYYLVAEH